MLQKNVYVYRTAAGFQDSFVQIGLAYHTGL